MSPHTSRDSAPLPPPYRREPNHARPVALVARIASASPTSQNTQELPLSSPYNAHVRRKRTHVVERSAPRMPPYCSLAHSTSPYVSPAFLIRLPHCPAGSSRPAHVPPATRSISRCVMLCDVCSSFTSKCLQPCNLQRRRSCMGIAAPRRPSLDPRIILSHGSRSPPVPITLADRHRPRFASVDAEAISNGSEGGMVDLLRPP